MKKRKEKWKDAEVPLASCNICLNFTFLWGTVVDMASAWGIVPQVSSQLIGFLKIHLKTGELSMERVPESGAFHYQWLASAKVL